MAQLTLSRLLSRKSEIRQILVDLSANAQIPPVVEDADGTVVFGFYKEGQGQRYPVDLDDQILGWVRGGESAAVIAAALRFAIRQESEKKSLVNELKERYRELSLLYRLSERMADSPEPESIYDTALEEVRRLIDAGSGAVQILDGEGLLRTVSSYGSLYEKIPQSCLMEQVVQTGKATLINNLSVDDCEGIDPDVHVSILGAPLRTDRRTLGVIVLVGGENQTFKSGDLKLLNTIAMHAGPILEMSHLYQELIEKARYEHELKMARQVQESLLPQQMPQTPGWEIATRWRPAREVSGDFYDVIKSDDTLIDMLIADVTDKGLPASLFMAFVRSILRVSIYGAESPEKIVTGVNQSICRDSYEGLFTTMVYARLESNTGHLTYVNAGHNPPLLYHARTGMVETFGRSGLPLGVELESFYVQRTAHLEEGDILLFYTDGITEATDPGGEEFGIERLKQQMLHHRHCDVEGMLDGIEAAVLEFSAHGQPGDDMTILGLRRLGAPGG